MFFGEEDGLFGFHSGEKELHDREEVAFLTKIFELQYCGYDILRQPYLFESPLSHASRDLGGEALTTIAAGAARHTCLQDEEE